MFRPLLKSFKYLPILQIRVALSTPEFSITLEKLEIYYVYEVKIEARIWGETAY